MRILLALLLLIIGPGMAFASQLPEGVTVAAYNIKNVPFNRYELPSDTGSVHLVFAQYGEMATVLYPASQENVIRQADAIVKSCDEAFLLNLDKIVKAQTENKAVDSYLTFDGKVKALSKDDFKAIVTTPQERTVQRDPAINKTVAEFRSKEFPVSKNVAMSVYITFICSQDKGVVETIIISVVKFEKQ